MGLYGYDVDKRPEFVDRNDSLIKNPVRSGPADLSGLASVSNMRKEFLALEEAGEVPIDESLKN